MVASCPCKWHAKILKVQQLTTSCILGKKIETQAELLLNVNRIRILNSVHLIEYFPFLF